MGYWQKLTRFLDSKEDSKYNEALHGAVYVRKRIDYFAICTPIYWVHLEPEETNKEGKKLNALLKDRYLKGAKIDDIEVYVEDADVNQKRFVKYRCINEIKERKKNAEEYKDNTTFGTF